MMNYSKQIFFLVMSIGILVSCNTKEFIEKMDKSMADSEYIMNNLSKPEIIDRFPEKYFPRQNTQAFIDALTKHCDFNSKRGVYVGYYTKCMDGSRKTAFIYEYILDCDSLRFIYIYNFDFQEPVLQKFNIEGLEVENKMIVDPENQLLNSK